MTLLWIALLLSLNALPQAPSTLSDSAKCFIAGTVLKAATGEPLKKARVVLQKQEPSAQPIVAITDATGHFSLKDIEPGRYRFWVERDGFVRTQYGQRSSQHPGVPLNLAPGQRLRDIVFRMVAGAVISGRILDDDLEPLARANVQVLRTVYAGGERRLASVARATTNDLGEYRLWGLPPGTYVLGATYARGMVFGSSGGARESQLTGTSATEESFGATYYSATTDPSRAAVIELHAGEEASRMDITLMRVRTFRIRGRVVNTVTGESTYNVSVYLQARGGPGSGRLLLPTAGNVKDAEGSFEIRGALPGSYTLVAQLSDEGQEFTAQQTVEVGNADLEGIQLVITRGMDLPGRVRIEGPSIALSKLEVWLQPKENIPFPSPNVSVKEDGSFLLKNVKGDSEVNVFQLPEGSYFKSARLGEDDVLERGLSTSRIPKGETLELVISGAGGRVDGVALNKDGQGVGGAAVILIPRSRETARLYKSTTTDQNGRYILQGIAPGEYKLFAWEDIETGAYRDPDFLRRYEDRGESLHVEENGRYTVELKVIPST